MPCCSRDRRSRLCSIRGARSAPIRTSTCWSLLGTWREPGRDWRSWDIEKAGDELGIVEVAGVAHAESPGRRGSRRDASARLIELHLWLPGSRAPASAAWDRLAARRTEIELCGRKVPVLNAEGQAMHLALHAAQHGSSYVRGQQELALALERWPLRVWEEAAGVAAEIDAVDAFAAGLRLLPRRCRAREGSGPARHGPARLGDQARREPTARNVSSPGAGGQAWTAWGARKYSATLCCHRAIGSLGSIHGRAEPAPRSSSATLCISCAPPPGPSARGGFGDVHGAPPDPPSAFSVHRRTAEPTQPRVRSSRRVKHGSPRASSAAQPRVVAPVTAPAASGRRATLSQCTERSVPGMSPGVQWMHLGAMPEDGILRVPRLQSNVGHVARGKQSLQAGSVPPPPAWQQQQQPMTSSHA